MRICIFEDNASAGLKPINLLRHASEIICGVFSLKEKIENISKKKYDVELHCRNYIYAYCKEKFPRNPVNKFIHSDYLFLNSRVIYTKEFIEGLLLTLDEFKNKVIFSGKNIVAFYVTADKVSKLKQKLTSKTGNNLVSPADLAKLGLREVQLAQIDKDETENIKIIENPADIIIFFEEELKKETGYILVNTKLKLPAIQNALLINKKRISFFSKTKIGAYSVLDASNGDIIIGYNSVVEPFSYIVGPAYIGSNSTVRSGAKLYGPVRVGDNCKVSGEIIHSILHSYVNKQHLGFLGHSYLCEWVNLGAGTTTSNLKNNYSRIILNVEGNYIDTGSIFLGSIFGDHTKTGINSMLNTGTLVGISSNLFGSGYQPKTISSFSWVDAGTGKKVKYDINKAINAAQISMKRRNVKMSAAYEDLMRYCYKYLSPK